jgi:hypothetical protein
VAGLVGELAASLGRPPTAPEVEAAARARLPDIGPQALRNDLRELERRGAIPRLGRASPVAGAAWRERITAERRQADAEAGRAGHGAGGRPITINNHRPRATASRLPPGVRPGYAERTCKRWRRWTREDRLVYEHWRSQIPPAVAWILFDCPTSPLLAGAGRDDEEDDL